MRTTKVYCDVRGCQSTFEEQQTAPLYQSGWTQVGIANAGESITLDVCPGCSATVVRALQIPDRRLEKLGLRLQGDAVEKL